MLLHTCDRCEPPDKRIVPCYKCGIPMDYRHLWADTEPPTMQWFLFCPNPKCCRGPRLLRDLEG